MLPMSCLILGSWISFNISIFINNHNYLIYCCFCNDHELDSPPKWLKYQSGYFNYFGGESMNSNRIFSLALVNWSDDAFLTSYLPLIAIEHNLTLWQDIPLSQCPSMIHSSSLEASHRRSGFAPRLHNFRAQECWNGRKSDARVTNMGGTFSEGWQIWGICFIEQLNSTSTSVIGMSARWRRWVVSSMEQFNSIEILVVGICDGAWHLINSFIHSSAEAQLFTHFFFDLSAQESRRKEFEILIDQTCEQHWRGAWNHPSSWVRVVVGRWDGVDFITNPTSSFPLLVISFPFSLSTLLIPHSPILMLSVPTGGVLRADHHLWL
jgi:hypothetical protein